MLLRGRLSTLGGYTIPIALAHGAQWLLDFEQQLIQQSTAQTHNSSKMMP
jgi:hypothetical protein